MANSIKIGQLADVISKELSGYTQDVADSVKQIVDDVAENLLSDTRNDAPKRKGKYRKAMAIKTVHESNYEKRKVWYVKAPHYRLSHLLEKGHAKRGGGRVQAFPHIQKNEEKAIQQFTERVEGAIKNGGK